MGMMKKKENKRIALVESSWATLAVKRVSEQFSVLDVIKARGILIYLKYICILKILEIDPCGEDGPLVIQTTYNGFIDSSVLVIDNDTRLSCKWKLKVQREKSLVITAHNVKLDDRWVS